MDNTTAKKDGKYSIENDSTINDNDNAVIINNNPTSEEKVTNMNSMSNMRTVPGGSSLESEETSEAVTSASSSTEIEDLAATLRSQQEQYKKARKETKEVNMSAYSINFHTCT